MSVRKAIHRKDGLYFITITCVEWLWLFEITKGYDIVYKWFDHLRTKSHFICGYVIMPNHLHALIAFRNVGQSINTIIGNGKRFMAYDIIDRLESENEKEVLCKLTSYVNDADRSKGQKHEVFETSFDWKECNTTAFISQKLDYIHRNPCRGNWNLVASPQDYSHSSARFYIIHRHANYPVTSYNELNDIDLTAAGCRDGHPAET